MRNLFFLCTKRRSRLPIKGTCFCSICRSRVSVVNSNQAFNFIMDPKFKELLSRGKKLRISCLSITSDIVNNFLSLSLSINRMLQGEIQIMILSKIESISITTIRENGLESIVDWFDQHIQSFYAIGLSYFRISSKWRIFISYLLLKSISRYFLCC